MSYCCYSNLFLALTTKLLLYVVRRIKICYVTVYSIYISRPSQLFVVKYVTTLSTAPCTYPAYWALVQARSSRSMEMRNAVFPSFVWLDSTVVCEELSLSCPSTRLMWKWHGCALWLVWTCLFSGRMKNNGDDFSGRKAVAFTSQRDDILLKLWGGEWACVSDGFGIKLVVFSMGSRVSPMFLHSLRIIRTQRHSRLESPGVRGKKWK